MNLPETMRIDASAVEHGSISIAGLDPGPGRPASSEHIEWLEKFVGHRLMSKSFRFPQMHVDRVLSERAVAVVTEGVDLSFRMGLPGHGAIIAYPPGRIRHKLVASRDHVMRRGSILAPAEPIVRPFIEEASSNGAGKLPFATDAGIVENVPARTMIGSSSWRPALEPDMPGLGAGVIDEYAYPDARRKTAPASARARTHAICGVRCRLLSGPFLDGQDRLRYNLEGRNGPARHARPENQRFPAGNSLPPSRSETGTGSHSGSANPHLYHINQVS
ncbi:hypothetical protein GQ56_0127495 [Burkholderia paludis]|uniref:hypothetical protein n=1 Tax=Burkholderia paludis TaxID=1506587 RepID=UPI0004DB6C41|nr:hypothetical protein [Burkholderia paludis]KFG94250.1 hypothetical protein GQ56_0127495 [Burkholderia paludis]